MLFSLEKVNDIKYQKNLYNEIYSWTNHYNAVAIAIYYDDTVQKDYITYSTINQEDDIFYPWRYYKCIYAKADLRNVTIDMNFIQNLMNEVILNIKKIEEQKLLCEIKKDFI